MSELLGRPIDGEVHHYSSRTIEQKPVEELLNALDALLNTEHVVSVKWREYTPYFMDGDVCEFGIWGTAVTLDFDTTGYTEESDEDEPKETKFFTEYDLYDWTGKDKVFVLNGVDTTEIYAALSKFESAIGSGQHDNVLKEKFGDPAEVTATKDGFSIEYYEHD